MLNRMFLTAAAVLVSAAALADDFWPKTAKVYFIEPKDGATVTSPVKVVMGLSGLGIAPAGVDKPNTGHHHILIDTGLPDLSYAMPMTDNIKHFGGGQTEGSLTLSPGTHTLQLIFGDGNHMPHDPPLVSDKITITVK
ncbi:DUF4399 domain-containing protein [Methylovirgula sp. 4M-Z18]|uniref:DUF4399 domain-containing protein n=1 Tax=Methylovirgula sp. 4M-Z18 TaxID=2293567 RepID=UPI000E2ECBC1|nr:DUF4399 domain-containing protein [Methylovirgula sp. 4M-Z18]RFB80659.1 DUF4399 domain-containing protein [Methylovirgula sp. 4M-Z18]